MRCKRSEKPCKAVLCRQPCRLSAGHFVDCGHIRTSCRFGCRVVRLAWHVHGSSSEAQKSRGRCDKWSKHMSCKKYRLPGYQAYHCFFGKFNLISSTAVFTACSESGSKHVMLMVRKINSSLGTLVRARNRMTSPPSGRKQPHSIHPSFSRNGALRL